MSSSLPAESEIQLAEEQEHKRKRQPPAKSQLSSLESGVKFPQTLLNTGFGFALFLSAACLFLSAYYLYSFLMATNSGLETFIERAGVGLEPATLEVAIQGRLGMARLALTSCGIFVGVSFGFLGFALFLLGIRKETDASAEYENFQVKFARLSPGLLIIICATVLIGICVTREIEFGYSISEERPTPSNNLNANTTTTPSPKPPPITNDNTP